ncbi:MAG: T9SS type A sorting domain-containing protein [Ignavibacteria bacterium]
MKIEFKILYTLLILYFFSSTLTAQQTSWYKTFNISKHNYQYGNYVIQTLDGGYAVIARDNGGEKIYLLKVDRYGKQEWLKTIDSLRRSSCILQKSDSSFIIAGSDFQNAKIINTDKEGNIIWLRSYSLNNEACSFYKIKLLNNGELIACGDIAYPSKAYIVKTDSSGNILWQKTVSDSGLINALDIAVSGHHYYITGSSLNQGKLKTILIKFSEYGNLQWFKKIGSDKYGDGEYGLAITYEQANKLAVAGTLTDYTFPTGYIAKYDTSGNLLDRKFHNSIYRLSSMTKDSCGYALCGENRFGNNIRFIKTNLEGEEIYNRVLDISNKIFLFSININSTSDNGYVISGNAGPEDSSEVLVIKTDSTGYVQPVHIVTISSEIPMKFNLFQNYPNPFNPSTKINYTIPNTQYTILKVYDALGKEVAQLVNQKQKAGSYEVDFDGKDLPSGIYFYKLSTGDFSDTKRMILLK